MALDDIYSSAEILTNQADFVELIDSSSRVSRWAPIILCFDTQNGVSLQIYEATADSWEALQSTLNNSSKYVCLWGYHFPTNYRGFLIREVWISDLTVLTSGLVTIVLPSANIHYTFSLGQ